MFCEIVAGRSPGTIPYVDHELIVLMDLNPVTPGHLVIVPRLHAESLGELPSMLGEKMFSLGKEMTLALQESELRAEGINMLLADGKIEHHEILHVHLHVFPRFQGDSFKITSISKQESREELERTGASVAAALARRREPDSEPSTSDENSG